ncbi:MAG TPA: ABC transporter permease subunit [Stellaceae bacterium]|nr:ABC transporter permease subunit [Stellaceae bacterium]
MAEQAQQAASGRARTGAGRRAVAQWAGTHRRLAPLLTGLATIAVLLVLWEGFVAIGWWSKLIAPAPSAIADGFAALFEEEGLAVRFLQTFGETAAAALLAIAAGVPVGLWLHRSRWAGRAYFNWVASIAAAPIVLLYPLFLVIFGRNAATIVAMSVCTGITSIILKTKEGLDGTRPVLIDVGRSFGLSRSQLFWKIMFPAAVPTIATGVRLGVIYCLISVVGIEFLINFGGLGELIDDLADRWETPMMFGAILFVMLTSVGFFWVTEKVEKWLRPM